MRILLIAVLAASCTPQPRDRTETCEKYVVLMQRCDGDSAHDVWMGRCKVAFAGDPNGATASEAELLARIRSLAECAATAVTCDDYSRCKDATRAKFHPR